MTYPPRPCRPLSFSLLAGALLLVPSIGRAQESAARERLLVFETTVRDLLANDPMFGELPAPRVGLDRRLFGEGWDLRVVMSGGDLRQRAALESKVADAVRIDEFWSQWVTKYGWTVVWTDPPADITLLEPVVPTPAEAVGLLRVRAAIQDHVEIDPILAGDLVMRVRLLTRVDETGRVLQLQGLTRDARNADRLRAVVQEVLAADTWWRTAHPGMQISLSEVIVAAPDIDRESRLFELGIRAFRHGDLDVAERAFTRAISLDPRSRILRYWKVVTVLAGHQHARAELLLIPLLREDARGQANPEVAFSLESVQGTLRQALVAHEQRLLLELPAPRLLPTQLPVYDAVGPPPVVPPVEPSTPPTTEPSLPPATEPLPPAIPPATDDPNSILDDVN